MKKQFVVQTSNSVNLDARIAQFIDKLSQLDQNSTAYANACTGEKRYLQGRYPAFRTYSNILGKYRAALAAMPICHHTYEKASAKLIAKYPHLDGVLVGECAAEVILAIKMRLKNLDELAVGEFEALSKLKVACKAYYSMRVSREQSVTISKANQAAVVAKKTNKVEVSLPLTKIAVKEGLNSASMTRRAIALSLCSGRRPIEIYKTARFEKVDARTVRFYGQAKSKGTGVRDGYLIPIVFVSVDEFLAAFKAFRRLTNEKGFNELSAERVHSRISKTASSLVRDVLQNDHITFYTCRSIYAEYAVVTIKAPSVDTQVYIANILGHSSTDIQTAQSYESVILVDGLTTRAPKKPVEKVLPLGVKEIAATTTTKKEIVRLKKLRALTVEGRAVSALHEWVLNHLKEEPAAFLTQTYIANRRSTSRPAIVKYLEIIGDLACI